MTKYLVSVTEILHEAERFGAQRVCFRNGTVAAVPVDPGRIEEALREVRGGTYAVQELVDGRWVDLGPAKSVVDDEFFSDLASWSFATEQPPAPDDVIAAHDAEPERLRNALRQLCSRTVERHFARPRPSGLTAIAEYLEQFREGWAEDPRLSYVAAYLSSLDLAFQAGLTTAMADPDAAAVNLLASTLSRPETSADESVGASAAQDCVLGQVLSLTDRAAAAEAFARLRTDPAADLVRFYYRDSGALTYYCEDDLTAISHLAGREIVRSITPVRASRPSTSLGVGVSVDPAFFRIYAGWLYFYAQQLDNVEFNIFLCGDETEVDDLLADADGFAGALGRLNRSGAPANVHLYRVPVPSYVSRAKTFYACARFFAADVMLERYPNVYFIDADLYLADNPTDYFRAIRDVAFGVPETTSAVRLSPWRRFAAGNLALNREVLETPVLASLQTYAAHGLRHSGDWMLDQNALTYVVEQDAGRVFRPLNDFDRPFVTSRFMSTWEANYRRATRG